MKATEELFLEKVHENLIIKLHKLEVLHFPSQLVAESAAANWFFDVFWNIRVAVAFRHHGLQWLEIQGTMKPGEGTFQHRIFTCWAFTMSLAVQVPIIVVYGLWVIISSLDLLHTAYILIWSSKHTRMDAKEHQVDMTCQDEFPVYCTLSFLGVESCY